MPLLGAHTRLPMPEPDDSDPLPTYTTVVAGETRRSVETRSPIRHHHLPLLEDGGLSEHPGNGLRSGETRDEVWTITKGDPLSARGEARWIAAWSAAVGQSRQ